MGLNLYIYIYIFPLSNYQHVTRDKVEKRYKRGKEKKALKMANKLDFLAL